MSVKLQLRRDTAATWTADNPILAQGEPGLETDTGKLKFGDGATAWASLSYFAPSGGGAVASVNGHTGTVTLAASDVNAAPLVSGLVPLANLPVSAATTIRATTGAPVVVAGDQPLDFAWDGAAFILYQAPGSLAAVGQPWAGTSWALASASSVSTAQSAAQTFATAAIATQHTADVAAFDAAGAAAGLALVFGA